ncbi:MAG: hypothetical protein IKC61_05275 [Clostridia bacterium]|nr:hypothetical protein [Clostridia bacterium]
MKKSLKLVISLVLCLAVVLSFVSCDSIIYYSKPRPKGYTGGFAREPHWYSGREIYWVETYEEAMTAIEHLEAAGNKIPYGVISSYENEIVDAKYCFVLDIHGAKKLKKGQEWYDRKEVRGLKIFYIGFLDKITIEELEFSYYISCKSIAFGRKNKNSDLAESITYECYKNGEETDGYTCQAIFESSGQLFAEVNYYYFDHYADLPADFHEEFFKTIVPIGG